MSEQLKNNGLVIRTTGSWYRVLTDDGTEFDCRLRGNYRMRGNKQTNPIAVGDHVEFQLLEDGTGMINDVADRRNYIVRRATKLSKQTHVIAANIDQLCIVATLGFPRTSTGFIDRLLVTAEAYHIPAVIIFNKCDLYETEWCAVRKSPVETACPQGADNGERSRREHLSVTPHVSVVNTSINSNGSRREPPTSKNENELWQIHNEIKAIYEGAGYPVFEVSALTGMGIDKIKELIAGKVTLFSGHSGVGKSALLNAIDPSLQLKTGEVSEWSLKGKHTTTFAEIFPINLSPFTIHNPQSTIHNSYLIDTPGIKEFGMVDFKTEELSHFFPEMRSVLHDCHFANCTHRHEPGCAVKAAVENGKISAERYQNYLNILESIESDAPIRR